MPEGKATVPISRRVVVGEHAGPGSALVEAGPLLFTSSFDGNRATLAAPIDPALAGAVEAQCENSYAAIAQLLAQAGLGMDSIVRLDHFTESQDWLPRRQSVRGRLFGKPAPLASTGVAARMAGTNLLSTAAIAVQPAEAKRVVVSGPDFGMANISSAVAAGPFVFVSGVRGRADPHWYEAGPDSPDASHDQTCICYQQIKEILRRGGLGADRILRIDGFLRDAAHEAAEAAARRAVLGSDANAVTIVSLPLGGRGEVEITAMALAQGDKSVFVMPDEDAPAGVGGGGFVFVGACAAGKADSAAAADAQRDIGLALDRLAARLAACESGLSQIVRLDVYLRDLSWLDELGRVIRAYFPKDPPAVAIAGADPAGAAMVGIGAIAVRHNVPV
ncbi:MAG: RidA family protein [Burkholderiaceae bacterium]